MRPSQTIALFIVTAAFLAACGPRTQYLPQTELEAGEEFEYSLVPHLYEGHTTRGEAQAYLGEPFVIESEGNREVWYYYYRIVRDRYGEDWSGRVVSWGRDIVDERAATLTFVDDVLLRIDTRVEPLLDNNPWVRATSPASEGRGSEYGPQSR